MFSVCGQAYLEYEEWRQKVTGTITALIVST